MIPLSGILAYSILPLFFIANLAIGIWAHTKAKKNSFEDYALASRSLPTGVMVMTLLGTFLSADHFASAGWVCKFGVLTAIIFAAIICVCMILGTFLAPYLVYFQNMITAGDLMGLFYGPFAQILTGVFSTIFSVIFISGQLKAVGHISAYFLKVNPSSAILCLGGMMILYSAWGGMRAVSYTDLLQMVITTLMILFVVNRVMQKVGGIGTLFAEIPSSHTVFVNHPDFWVFLRYICFCWIIPSSLLSPPVIQRMLMSEKRQVRKMWYGSALFLFFIFGMFLLVTFSSFAMGIKVDDNTGSITSLFLTVVSTLLKKQWMLNFVCVGMLAVAISTLDSYFHALGISIVQDFIIPIRSFWALPPLEAKSRTFFQDAVLFF